MVSSKVKCAIAFCVIIALCEIACANPLEKIKQDIQKFGSGGGGRSKRAIISPLKDELLEPVEYVYLILVSLFFYIEAFVTSVFTAILSLPVFDIFEPLLLPIWDDFLEIINAIVTYVAEVL